MSFDTFQVSFVNYGRIYIRLQLIEAENRNTDLKYI